MDIDFKTKISTLSTRHRVWFCTAMVAMVLADGNIERNEVDFIIRVLGLIKDDAAIERLKKFIQYKTVPPLGAPMGIDRKLGMSMIVDLIRIAVSDNVFAESEKHMIRDIGGKLGFSPPEVEKLVMFGFELIARPQAAGGATGT
ncbi:MAG: TerB family tellurite resistance protein [Candidatus Lambdaproteobacteria bacterium]|nr:TerB family tellurite resistance protein [Candidatus Lambdaproteobacteria bacterium]